MKKIFIGVFIVAGLLLVGEVSWISYFLLTPNSQDSSYKIILLEPGPMYKTAEFLQKEGLIQDPKRFMLVIRLLRLGSKIRVGEYEVRMNMTPLQVLRTITSGKSVLHAVHIPEGFNVEQVAETLASHNLVNKDEFLKLVHNPQMAKLVGVNERTLEGYLYPETYSFTHFTGGHAIIKTMVEKFKEVYDREVKFGAEKTGMSMHDIVTLASIVEKETGAPEERPLISSVFHNRMKLRMPLQSDPTVIYGKIGDKKNITKKDLLTPSPYNTYTLKGLPIGPISNPGKGSLIAVIDPAVTKYLYFVSKNDGTHFFSATYGEHNAAVRKYQMDPKAREGKSWRDRLKKVKKDSKSKG